jgi:hypothetical protein
VEEPQAPEVRQRLGPKTASGLGTGGLSQCREIKVTRDGDGARGCRETFPASLVMSMAAWPPAPTHSGAKDRRAP